MSSSPGMNPERDRAERHLSAAGNQAFGRRQMALHQPPNAQDMQRTPPRTPACARVRGLLRDYADGDLVGAMVIAVDEHVHTCRICAVELARAEHEVLRLRRAFESIRVSEDAKPGHTLRPDFAARCVEQLVLTQDDGLQQDDGLRQEGEADLAAASGAAIGGEPVLTGGGRTDAGRTDTGRADTVRTGWARYTNPDSAVGASAAAGGLFRSPAGVLLASLLALFVLGVGLQSFGDGDIAPERSARLVVLEADEFYGSDRRLLAQGESVLNAESLWVRRGGKARVDWHDPSDLFQPAATIDVLSGELRFEDGAPVLMGGKALVETHRSVDVPMVDGSKISLGMGEYIIAALPADMQEGELLAAEDVIPGAAASNLRIEVETRSGAPAVILRSGAESKVVGVGTRAAYRGGGNILVVAGNGGELDADLRSTPPPEPVVPMATLTGEVRGPGGQPAAGASVVLRYAAHHQERNGLRTTGADGSFSLQTTMPCDGDFAVVMSLPSAQRRDLGVAIHQAVPLTRKDGVARLDGSLEIGHAAVLNGVVRDDSGDLRAGVRVLPIVCDELFGSVYALTAQQTLTNSAGSFAVEQLPAKLPNHHYLALLLSRGGLAPTVVPVPTRGSLVATEAEVSCVMRRLRVVSMRGLQPNSIVTVLEEVPGLPVGSAAVRRLVPSNELGEAAMVKVGTGTMWLRSGNQASPQVTRLTVINQGGVPRYQPAATAVPFATRFRVLQSLSGSEIKLVNSYRYEHFEVRPIENAVAGQSLQVVDAFGHAVEKCEVFAVRQSKCQDQPDPRLLGFTDAFGVLNLGAVDAGEDVLVVAPNGALAWESRPAAGDFVVTLSLQATGRIYLHESLRPSPSDPNRMAKIVLRRATDGLLQGMTPVAVRFAGDANQWEVSGIPSGSYLAEVGGEEMDVIVPSTGFVELRRN